MSREMKHSGTDWIGEIPVQWELAPTKRVFRGKKRIVGDEADNYERLALTLNGVVKRNKDDNEGLQPEQFNGYQILEKNELVFKLIDLQNIRTSRVGLSPYTGIVSPAYIILSNSETDNRFYYYWFMDMYNRCIFNQMGDDGVRSALNIKDVLEIPLPLIAESTRIKIASFLDKKCEEIDEMIALQEKIIDELKAYKQSVITESVTKGLNPDVPMKDSGIEWIGEIPEHWIIKRGKHTLNLLKRPVRDGDEVVTCFRDGDVILRSLRRTEGFTMSDKEIGYQGINEGDIVIHGMDGFAGAMGVSKSTGKGSPVLVVCESKYDAYPQYVIYYLRTLAFRDVFISLSTGIRERSCDLRWNKIAELPFILPSMIEQMQISEYLDTKCTEIDNLISIKLSKIDSLKEYKKSIIYEYVTGKKDVIE